MTFTKKAIFSHICKICNNEFQNRDVKGVICLECRKPRLCLCGCNKFVKKPGSYYRQNHSKKGKTYKEIYGTNTPTCGYQRGNDNVAKRKDIRKKISKGVKKSYKDPKLREHRRENCYFLSNKGIRLARRLKAKDNNLYRSSYEVKVANFLYDNDISYEYERRVLLNSGKVKIVDFIVNNILIEITGYAFKDWQTNFNERLKMLRDTVKDKIVIITYNKKIKKISSFIKRKNLKNVYVLGENFNDLLLEHIKVS